MRRQLFYRICTLRLFIQNRIITALWERLAGKLIYPNERWSRRCKKAPDSNDLNEVQRRESWKKLIVKASQSLNMLIRPFHKFHFSILLGCQAGGFHHHLQGRDRKASGWSGISVGGWQLFINYLHLFGTNVINQGQTCLMGKLVFG